MIEKGDAVALDNLKTIESMRRVISTHTLGRDCTLFRYVNSTELARLWEIRDPRPGWSTPIPNDFFNLVGTKKYAQPILDELKNMWVNRYQIRLFYLPVWFEAKIS